MRPRIFAAAALLSLLVVVPLAAQNCQAGLPCAQVPWAFPPLPILLSPSPIPTTVATAAPPPTMQSGLIQPTPTALLCPTGIPGIIGISTYKEKVLGLSPTAYWPMDEVSGSTAGDASGAGIAGTYTGATLNDDEFIGGGAAPTFDGVNDYVTLPAPMLGGALSWTQGTITGWLKMDYDTEWFTVTERIILDIQKNDGYIIIYKSGPGTLTADVMRGGNNNEMNIEVPLAPGDEWTFFALAWTPYSTAFRVDATEEPFVDLGGAWGRNLLAARIGAETTFGSNSFNGALAHIAVFDRILGNHDIDALAIYGLGGIVSPDGCVIGPTAAAPFDIDAIAGIMDAAQMAQTPAANLNSAPAYDLYGNSLNFFSVLLGLREVDIGPFTPLVIALFAGFFLHVTVFVIERSAPIIAVIIGVARKLIQLVLDFLPG